MERFGRKEFWGAGVRALAGAPVLLPLPTGVLAALRQHEAPPPPTAAAPNKGPAGGEGRQRCSPCVWIWTPGGPPGLGTPRTGDDEGSAGLPSSYPQTPHSVWNERLGC